MQIDAEGLVALVALVVSIFTLFRGERIQRALQKSQSEHEALQSNVSLLVDVWSRIGSKPSLLRFHGINEEELKAAGVDVEELVYLIASFQTAGYYYEHIDKGTGPFPQNSLRYRMCASEATRKAWPLLKSFFVGSPTYVSRIEDTIKLLEREGSGKSIDVLRKKGS